MPVEVDAEVGGQHEGDTAAPLTGALLLVGGKVGADETGIGAVEGEAEAVGGAVRGER